jgi:hypothetical protein
MGIIVCSIEIVYHSYGTGPLPRPTTQAITK